MWSPKTLDSHVGIWQCTGHIYIVRHKIKLSWLQLFQSWKKGMKTFSYRLSYCSSILSLLQHPSNCLFRTMDTLQNHLKPITPSWKCTLNIFMRQVNLWIFWHHQIYLLEAPSFLTRYKKHTGAVMRMGKKWKKIGTMIWLNRNN